MRHLTHSVVALFVVAFVAMTAFPAFSVTTVPDSQCMRWTHPGSNINQLDLRDTVKLLVKEEPQMEEPVYQKYRKAVVFFEDVDSALRASKYSKQEQDRIFGAFTRSGKKFWGPGGIQKLQIPAEFKQTMMLRIDTTVFTPTKMRRGDRIDGFIFERIQKPCAIYDPEKGQPAEITVNEISVEIPGTDDIFVVRHSEECSNAGKAKRRVMSVAPAPAPKAQPVALRVESAPKSQEGWKHVDVWLFPPSSAVNGLKQSHVPSNTEGVNSRDLCKSEFFDASGKPKAPVYTGGDLTVDYIFTGVDFDKAHGQTIRVNGDDAPIPTAFTKEKPLIPVVATKEGRARISLSPEAQQWMRSGMVFTASFERFKDRVAYPNPAETSSKLAVLSTCVRGIGALADCGRTWTEDVGEFYKWYRKVGSSTARMCARLK